MERRLSVDVVRAVLWRRLDLPSLEHGRLLRHAGGHILDGRIVMQLDDAPAEVHYSVLCGTDWKTVAAAVTLIRGAESEQLQLRVDAGGRWWRDDEQLTGVDDAVDVDIQLTPSTNILPLRRLALEVGESRSVAAAWIRFPQLTVERLEQRYTRTGADSYRYESGNGAFSADLSVDEEGVVIRYGEVWERVATYS